MGKNPSAISCPSRTTSPSPDMFTADCSPPWLIVTAPGQPLQPPIAQTGAPWIPNPPLRFLTASLHVDYLKPTPLGIELEIRGRVKEVKGRKVVIEEWIIANGITTVRGEVVAVQVPDEMVEALSKGKPDYSITDP